MKKFKKSSAVLSVLLSTSLILGNLSLPLLALAEDVTESDVTVVESLPELPIVSAEETPAVDLPLLEMESFPALPEVTTEDALLVEPTIEIVEVVTPTPEPEEKEKSLKTERIQNFLSAQSERSERKNDEQKEGKRRDYVEGEILVKYKNASINLETSAGQSAAMSFEGSKSLERKEDMRRNNISHLRIRDGKTVEEKVAELKNDPNVEYAQPNYQYYATEISANDTHRGVLWGLDNTSQTVGGTDPVHSGVGDADVDAPEAWAISEATTTTTAIVAVIDSGVAYNHPDLIANMWDGTNCVNENGVFLGGCNHGYDFDNGTKMPLATSSSHGTHIAGTIAAVKNNNKGIIGVAPQAKIMALKTPLTTAGIVMAINFAKQNGARVINASWAGTYYDTLMRNAISSFPGVFIVAAGNGDYFGDPLVGDNHEEQIHVYPSDYDLPNIISVAATDQNDGLATLSDYGAISVDVGAPGTNIFSTVASTEPYSENFEGVTPPNLPSGLVKGGVNNKWASFNDATWGKGLKTQSSSFPYDASADTIITSPTIVLGGNMIAATIDFWTKCDTEYTPFTWSDYVELEYSPDGVTFSPSGLKWDESFIDSDTNSSGAASHHYKDIQIPSQFLSSSFTFRFLWHTNASDNNHDGCVVDDIKVTKFTDGWDEQYEYYNGTSMAAPHVAGLAALIWGVRPDLSTADVKNTILNTGDSLPSLNGKILTGKRINAFTALNSLVVTSTDSTPPVIVMNGSSTVNIVVGDVYADAGATALDNVDGNVTANIVAVSTVSTSTAGAYSVKYNVSDAAGNHAVEAVRTVNVASTTPPAPVATTTWSQTITLSSGWNIVSTPRLLESHTFSAPETLSNFAIYTLDPTRPSKWATMADLGQSEFAPLYGYFINNKTGVSQTLKLQYKASTTPNERLFERTFTTPGWYSFGIASPSYAKKLGEGITDTNNPDRILNSLLGAVSNYDSVIDFTDASHVVNPDNVALVDAWKSAIRSADVANATEINSLKDFRETKGYAIYIKAGSTLNGFQNATVPQCADAIDNDADGLIDYPADNACFSSSDDDESPALIPGTLSITKAVDSPATSIVRGGTAFTLAKFNIQANGERLKVENLRVTFSTSNASWGSIRNGAIFLNGVQIGSTANIQTATATQFNLGSGMTLDAGTPYTLEVRGDAVDADGTNDVAVGDTLQVRLVSGSLNVYKMNSSDYVSSPAVAANTLTVSGGTLSLAKYAAYANQNATVPQTAYKVGEYRLTTGGTEGVNLDTLSLSIGGSDVTKLQSVYIVYGTKTTVTKATVASTSNTYSMNEVMPANSTMSIAIYASLSGAMTSGQTITTTLAVSGTSQTSAVAVSSGTSVGQTVTVATGSLTSAVDASTPVSSLVVANSMPKVGSFKFSGVNDSFMIEELTIGVQGGATAAVAIKNIVVKDGATTVATMPLNASNVALITGLTVPVAYNTNKVLDVYAELGTIGSGGALTGQNVGVSLNGYQFLSSNGEKTIVSGGAPSTTPAFYAFKTRPTINNIALPTTLLSAGTQTVAKFNITADAGGAIAWRRISLNFATSSGLEVTGWQIYDSANESTPLSGTTASVDYNSKRITFNSTIDQEISGSKTYTVKVLMGGTITIGASISHSITTSGLSFAAPSVYATVAGTPATFIWSDESVITHSGTTLDWMNDYLVKSLPTDSQTLTK